MTITEARKRCDELQRQIEVIQKEYLMAEGYAKYMGEQKIKPIYDEWNKLMTLITKAENETDI